MPARESEPTVEWTKAQWREALRCLPKDYRKIVKMRFQYSLWPREIAVELGLSRQRVERILASAMERLAKDDGLRKLVEGV